MKIVSFILILVIAAMPVAAYGDLEIPTADKAAAQYLPEASAHGPPE